MKKILFENIDKFALSVGLHALNPNNSKGIIAIVVAQDELSATQHNGIEIAKMVKEGIIEKNFNAKFFFAPVIPCITNENRFNIQLRELTAQFVEQLSSCNLIEGFVFISSNIYSLFGMLKGAISSNLPCIFIPNGCMNPISIEKQNYDFLSLNKIPTLLRYGKMHPAILTNINTLIEEQLANDTFCYETNCGAFMMQTLGVALPNTVGVIANSLKQKNLAYETGIQICKLAEQRLSAKNIITIESLKMALAVDIVLGGSANAYVNLSWIANAIEEKINFETIEKILQFIPNSSILKENFDIRNFEKNGGVYGIIENICNAQNTLKANYICFNNEKMIDFCKSMSDIDYKFNENQIIAIQHNQYPLVKILSGNLANSAISYKVTPSPFIGYAKIFYSEDQLVETILNNKINSGDCIVLPYSGAKGGLFTPLKSICMLNALDIAKEIAIISDGVIPSFFEGISISLINDEAYDDSPFAYIKNGDRIEINLLKGKLNFDVNSKDLKIRRKEIEIKEILKSDKNYIYSKYVSSPEYGCNINCSAK